MVTSAIDLEERVGDQRHLVDLAAHEELHERAGAALQRFAASPSARTSAPMPGLAVVLGDELADVAEERLEVLAAVACSLRPTRSSAWMWFVPS